LGTFGSWRERLGERRLGAVQVEVAVLPWVVGFMFSGDSELSCNVGV